MGRPFIQDTNIIDHILGLFPSLLILVATLWIIGVVIAMDFRKKPKGKVKGHLIKQMQKMENEAGKDRKLTVPPVRSRQEIITEMFESQLSVIGLEASTTSGYIPASKTPFAIFLKERDVHEDIVSAVIDGIMEEETEKGVRAIIEAASPELGLSGNELEKVKDLAVEEWRNVRETSAS